MPALRLIHRTAIIDPKARIDSDVVIGPYALIEGPVEISSGTEIQGRAVIVGSVQIGKNNRIGHRTVIGSFPQDLSFNPTANSGVKIGENNVIHEFCTIHRGTKEGSNTFVGSNNLLMAGAHLGHNTRLGNNITLENNVLLGGYAEIDDQALLGSGSVVHQFTRVGAISLLHGVSAISKDIPPFSTASGKNSVSTINVSGLARAGFGSALRNEVKEAFALLYRKGLNLAQALEEVKKRSWSKEVSLFWDFVETSKRGICPVVRWKEVRDFEE